MQENILKTLNTIKDHIGTSAFSNPKQFKGALEDIKINNDADIIRNMLKIAICDLNAYSRLEKALIDNHKSIIDDLVAEMVSKFMTDITVTKIVIYSIAGLLGYESKLPSNYKIGKVSTIENIRPINDESKNKQDEQSLLWHSKGLCYYCGGKFGFITKKCKTCKAEVVRIINNILPKPVRANTVGNIACGGLSVSQGEWFYFSNFKDSFKLYKSFKNSDFEEKICDDGGSYINIIDDWLYYCSFADNDKLYKVMINGTGREKLNDDNIY